MTMSSQEIFIPREPLSGRWIWSGSDKFSTDDWVSEFSSAEITEIAHATEKAHGKALDQLTPDLFPLPTLSKKLSLVERELAVGAGFVLLRGLRLENYTEDEIETLYCGIGAHLGVLVSQSQEGDRLGHVIDRGGTDRFYTGGGELEFHMDPVDVVGLLCLRAAVKGGASRIVSAMAVHNIILQERPDLLRLLYRGFYNSGRGFGEETTDVRVPTYASGADEIECYYLPIIVRQAAEEGFAISRDEQEAFDFVGEVASRPGVHLDMNFQEGDIQFLNNRTILHARTDYVDHPDPAQKRHLLRLWLVMQNWPQRAQAMDIRTTGDRAGGGIQPANVND